MDLFSAMRLFTKAVEAGSFSEAGRQLGLNASSVARQVGALEDELEARLLNRTTRKLSLTDAGRIYYERSRSVLAEVEDAGLAISDAQGSPRGRLRLSIPVVFGRRYIAPVLREFLHTHPDVHISLLVTDDYVDLIEGGLDLAVRIGGPSQQTYIVRRLASINRVLCASASYLAEHGEPETPEDLARHNCLIYRRRPGEVTWLFERDGAVHEIPVTGNLESNDAENLAAAMRAGLGVALLPLWVVGRAVQSGAARALLTDFYGHPSHLADDVYAVYPHNRNLSPKVRAFVDFLALKFKDQEDFSIAADAVSGAGAI